MAYMRFSRRIFYIVTFVLILIGLTLVLAGNSLFAMPEDFHSTKEQRSEYYPSNWHYNGEFNTEWELITTDSYYDYFVDLTSHSYHVQFSLKEASDNTVNITFTSISTDSKGYGNWLFFIDIWDMNQASSLGYISDFTSEVTINVPELEGYRFTLTVQYSYFACIAGIGDECIASGLFIENFVRSFTVNLNSQVWEEYKEGYKQLTISITNAIIFLGFTLEYAINFKERKKAFRIIQGISYGANGAAVIYSLVNVFKAVTKGTIVEMTSPTIVIAVAVSVHLVINIIEGIQLETKAIKQKHQRQAYSQPAYKEHAQAQPQQYGPSKQQEMITKQKSFSPSIICTNCASKEHDTDAGFCTTCGSKLEYTN